MTPKSLGPYQILEPLGKGGMGEVYRAHDPSLKRDVAIKVLPAELASDPDRLARLEREAHLLAALNHPNVATIHGLEEAQADDGTSFRFLVLELVEGDTVEERLRSGPLEVEEALEVAAQIARGLEAAHAQGIVHRDLKPGNVKITPDGLVKVLDFGLAKPSEAVEREADEEGLTRSPTVTVAGTEAGVILGTVAYMSPEQARGQAVDRRTDVWSFGCVLYEMLTGERLFRGNDATEILAAIMRDEPDPSSLPSDLSPVLRLFVRRCLEKDPNRRLRDIGDMRLALEGAFEIDGGADGGRRGHWLRPAVPWLIAASVTVAAMVGISSGRWAGRDADPSMPRERRFTIETVEGTTLPAGSGYAFDVSRDGEMVVYAAQDDDSRRLYLRSLSEFEARPIQGTHGALMPFLDPQGEWVAFGNESLTAIKRVPLSGGEPFTVCTECVDGHWGDDGSLVFAREKTGSLLRIPDIGADPEVVLEPVPELGIVAAGRPNMLPGGRAVVFDINPFGCGGVGVVSLDGGQVTIVTDHGTDPFYSPTGHIVFARERSLFAVPFDLARLEVTGREIPVLSGVRVENGGTVQAKLSSSGSLVYVSGADEVGTRLVLVDRTTGRVERVLEQGRFFRAPRLSPDGEKIAVQINSGGSCDLWVREGATMRPLTDTGHASNPIWTPDGRTVTFSSRSGDSFAIQMLPSDGSGEVRTLLTGSVPLLPEAWSPDGTRLIFRENPSAPDLFVTDTREPGSRRGYVVSDFAEHSAALSPSGEWVAYVSDQTGSPEVYVRPFPGPGKEHRVSRGGGANPSWGSHDRELIFMSADQRLALMAELRLDRSPIEREGPVEETRTLFDATAYWRILYRTQHDVHPDGQRLLMLSQRDTDESRSTMRVAENWFLHLKRLLEREGA